MSVLAREIMNPEVISVPTTMDLRDLAKLFLEKGITGAPVVDEDGHLAGVISQTDLVYYNLTRGDELVFDSDFYQSVRVEGSHVPRGFQFEDFNTGCVADVMTPVVHSVTERATVTSVARVMMRNRVHRVIVRRGQAVAGIISAIDVLRACCGAPKAARRSGSTRAAPERVKTATAGRKRDAKRPARKKRAKTTRGRPR
jgi:CBS domain-containing protein